jgi:predicted nucleotidyltransferase
MPPLEAVPSADLSGDDPDFACQKVSEEVFCGVLREATEALAAADLPYCVIGGVASAVHGRPRWTYDIDLFVRPEDAAHSLEALGAAGFLTDEKDDNWIYKAIKHGVLVDVIFKARGDLYLDEDMIGRLVATEFRGVALRIAPAEDMIVIKALVHDEATPRHWHDALAMVAHADLDWDYLLRRARHGPRRVLSLLVYAQSNDLAVPDDVVRSLFEVVNDA